MIPVIAYAFDQFQTLDFFGPVDVLGSFPEFPVSFYSERGGLIKSAQGVPLLTRPVSEAPEKGIFFLPGGMGTRPLVHQPDSLAVITRQVERCCWCLSVCTGSAVLAKCGVLDGKKATTNKRAFDWVRENGPLVNWERHSRWSVDGKFYTSSGVSAGIDMALGFVSDRFGRDRALETACRMEYLWHENRFDDSFA
jgi:transcriptional regulator GlxA family with amidase domain